MKWWWWTSGYRHCVNATMSNWEKNILRRQKYSVGHHKTNGKNDPCHSP